MKDAPHYKMIPSEIARIAIAEIGTREIGESNCGVRVNLYKGATSLPPAESWPWCAAFVCWVVREAMLLTDTRNTDTFRRPTTAGAWDLIRWSLSQDDSTHTKRRPGRDIQAGDIIVYEFSHCGIAISGCGDAGNFVAVEGNTSSGDAGSQRDGGGVFKRVRRSDQVRARIRLAI